MRHFDQFAPADRARLFSVLPQVIGRDSDRETLALALGATLYMPATRPTLCADLVKQGRRGVTSVVVCLEDAIADDEVAAGLRNVVVQVQRLAQGDLPASLPLLFVRVRHHGQIHEITAALGPSARLLSGFVLPKFTALDGAAALEAVVEAGRRLGTHFYAMPVLESAEVAHHETRQGALGAVRQLLDRHRDHVLAVRIGATDLCAAYGVRRDRELTIYDVRVVADAITDIVNAFGRTDGTGTVVTGPVWEYFPDHERIFKTQLRETPFNDSDARALRQQLLLSDLDGLIRELVLDKANGLRGKSVIHPTHVVAVNVMSVVMHEEHVDALDVLAAGRTGGGAMSSGYRNKMNESKPHRAWAQRTVCRARVFGVAAPGVSYVDLLTAGVDTLLTQDAG